MRSLVAQHAKSPLSLKLDMQLFVMDTEESTPKYATTLASAVDRVNQDLGRVQAHMVLEQRMAPRQHKNAFYGYDSTDELLALMLSLPQCEWVLLTNGDNMYNGAW